MNDTELILHLFDLLNQAAHWNQQGKTKAANHWLIRLRNVINHERGLFNVDLIKVHEGLHIALKLGRQLPVLVDCDSIDAMMKMIHAAIFLQEYSDLEEPTVTVFSERIWPMQTQLILDNVQASVSEGNRLMQRNQEA
ncbi:MAG: hypothetical protein ACYS1A_19050, partial [Planctomycetota bacterium]